MSKFKPAFTELLIVIGMGLAACGQSPDSTVETVEVASVPDVLEAVEPTEAPTEESAEPANDRSAYPAPAEAADPYPAPVDPYPAEAEATDLSIPSRDLETMSCFPDAPGDTEVTFVTGTAQANGSWTFAVTLLHPDTGDEDYANGWSIFDSNCNEILTDPADEFTRLLLHPHVNEQPFTRSQGGIVLPADASDFLVVHGHDTTDGWSPQAIVIDMATDEGEGYALTR